MLARNIGRWMVLLSLSCASVIAQEPRPLRVLFLTGGGYHDFRGNPSLLQDGLESLLPVQITTVMLQADDEPDADAAGQRPAAVLQADLARKYDVVMAYHQGEKLGVTREELDNLLSFVRRGGAFVGLHCAADSFKWCREYMTMVGGRFVSHPPIAPLRALAILGNHPVMAGVGDFEVKDEFYYVDDLSLEDKNVVLVGMGPTDGRVRPLAWTKRYGEGRVFVTVLGHGAEAHGAAPFQRLVANGLRWTTTKEHWAKGQDGWRTLFDGRSLRGFTHVGPGSFKVRDGVLQTNGGMGLLWFDPMTFADFELELEYQLTGPEDNSGVFVRFPDPPRSPWDAVQDGYEVQIHDTGGEKANTGSIYSFAAATRQAGNPVGTWNRMRITVRGQDYVVEVNGEQVCTFRGSRALRGHVGLQNHGIGEVVNFRAIRIRELGVP